MPHAAFAGGSTLEVVAGMTKEELVRKLAACDAEVEELKSQIRRLQARLEELERERRRHLEQLEHGDYELTT